MNKLNDRAAERLRQIAATLIDQPVYTSKQDGRLQRWLRLFKAGRLDAHWTALLLDELIA